MWGKKCVECNIVSSEVYCLDNCMHFLIRYRYQTGWLAKFITNTFQFKKPCRNGRLTWQIFDIWTTCATHYAVGFLYFIYWGHRKVYKINFVKSEVLIFRMIFIIFLHQILYLYFEWHCTSMYTGSGVVCCNLQGFSVNLRVLFYVLCDKFCRPFVFIKSTVLWW
jgi:hypothetical protein